MLLTFIHLFIVTNQQVMGHDENNKTITLVILIGWAVFISGGIFLAEYSTIVDPTCLYFRLTLRHSQGWGITIGLVLIFNFLVYCTIGCLLCIIIRMMQKSRQAAGRKITPDEISLLARQVIITVNCFLLWLVIASICLYTMLSEQVDPRINGWLLCLVFPINAGCNPILYTFATVSFKDQVKHLSGKLSNTIIPKCNWNISRKMSNRTESV